MAIQTQVLPPFPKATRTQAEKEDVIKSQDPASNTMKSGNGGAYGTPTLTCKANLEKRCHPLHPTPRIIHSPAIRQSPLPELSRLPAHVTSHFSRITKMFPLKNPNRFAKQVTTAGSKQLPVAVAVWAMAVGSTSCDRNRGDSRDEPQAATVEARPVSERRRESASTMARLRSNIAKRNPGEGLDFNTMQLLKELAVSNPNLALEAYTRNVKTMDFHGLLEIARLIAENHPEFIAEWLQSDLSTQVEDPDDRAAFAIFLLPALAEVDSAAAFDVLEHLMAEYSGDGTAMGRLAESTLGRMGVNDPEDAVRQVLQRYEGQKLNASLLSIARGAAAKDVHSAITIINEISSPQDRLTGMATVLGAAGIMDYSNIAPVIAAMDGSEIFRILQSDPRGYFTDVLYESDPEAVKRALDGAALTESNLGLLGRYVNSQFAKNPVSTLAFVLGFPESPMRDGMLMPAFANLARNNFDTAMNTIPILDGNAKSEALRGIASVAGRRGFDFMSETLKNLDPETRALFISNSIESASKVDLQKSLHYVDSGAFMMDTEDAGTRSSVVHAVSQNYTVIDPAAAFEWIGTLSEDLQAKAMQGYATQRARSDLASLAEELSNMPHDARWRAGVTVLISNLRNSDPARAVQWEEALENE